MIVTAIFPLKLQRTLLEPNNPANDVWKSISEEIQEFKVHVFSDGVKETKVWVMNQPMMIRLAICTYGISHFEVPLFPPSNNGIRY